MQSKWRAPACYIGVAVICAIYLVVVPGVSVTDICAGAGLGAAVMWAINEWETGKWNVVLPGAAVAAQAPQAAVAMAAEVNDPAALAEYEARPRVDSGVATRETLEKWDVDDREPDWDPSALADTWAKLRRELSLKSGQGNEAVAPDLPRTAQLARPGQIAAATSLIRSGQSAGAAIRPQANGPASGGSPASRSSAAPAQPARPLAGSKAPLGSLAKAYASGQRSALSGGTGGNSTVSAGSNPSGSGLTGSTLTNHGPSGKAASGLGSSAPSGQGGGAGTPAAKTAYPSSGKFGGAATAASASSTSPTRKAPAAKEPPRQPGTFLRPR
ncbi:hypothetical protein [Ancylobacter amanitiformis]|uniref:Uncharacterized protein n=1 Tax=Ancylobacter amanitiformis TaxID=217069 RepID=A0ABU0LX86_9HYPH|nr:hypothetical protein [Ancylobacter amanitiformis]MDQ0513342.1 hypothetical protein [Ancylobacter amanitiformis]